MAQVPHMNFIDSLKKTLGSQFNSSRTENGALGFRSTGQKLLDLNFAVSSLRGQPDDKVAAQFSEAFFEDPRLAVKWLFYAADVREGMGERRLFRICLVYLAEHQPNLLQALLPLIPEYTRWDNVLCLLDTKLSDQAATFLKEQLTNDMEQLEKGTSISLCAKWMPSANASSKKTRHLADILVQKFGITERQYRKLLSKLRSNLNLVETAMSRREWGSIRYEEVPSRANLIYNTAFLRNDEARRRSYLEHLSKGEVKIHAGVLFPHDIVHKYTNSTRYYMNIAPEDAGLEELWKSLPKPKAGLGTTLCVADGSGSMFARIGKTEVSCLEVANALAIYFAENCCGPFQDKYITFSATPQLVDFSKAHSLKEKLEIALHYNEVSNTNIEAVFDLILTTAIQNHLSKEELPQNILILSDMEFDVATRSTNRESFYSPSSALFEEIKHRFLIAGYQMPRLIFWNLYSRTGTIPLLENACGVALLSGFSVQTLNMVQSGKLDPYQCLLEQINAQRYEPVEAILNQFF